MCATPGMDAGADAHENDGAVPPQDVSTAIDTPPMTDAVAPGDSRPTPDAPTSMDATLPDASGTDVLTVPDASPSPDVPPADTGPDVTMASCSSLPMTASRTTMVMIGSLPFGAYPTASYAFTPAGLLGLGGEGSGNSGSLTIYSSDGFTRLFFPLSSSVAAIRELHFLSDTVAVTVGVPSSLGVDLRAGTATASLYSHRVTAGRTTLAIDREGGIYYIDGDRVFRAMAGTVGPGDLVSRGLMNVDSMAINADASALFYVSNRPPMGVYRVALHHDSSGVVTGDAPGLYFSADALGGIPTGIALDVCGNVYTADVAAQLAWRIPTGPTPSVGGARPVAIASGTVGRPQFGVGPGFDPTRLYFDYQRDFGGGTVAHDLYSAPVGVMGVRQ